MQYLTEKYLKINHLSEPILIDLTKLRMIIIRLQYSTEETFQNWPSGPI